MKGILICYSSPNTKKMNENDMSGSCGMSGTGAYRILVGKPEGKRSLG